MGLLDKLLGRSKNREVQARAAVLDAVRATTAEPMRCAGCLERLRQTVPAGADFDLRLEVVNRLFELDRMDWAEAYALELTSDPACPLPVLKGLARHFIAAGRVEKVEGPIERLIVERPTETEFAALLGRHLVRGKQYERALDLLREPLDSAPDARHLYAIVGECHLRLGRHEDALGHLRTACELFEDAFRLRQVVPDELNAEQLEYTRLYALLEEAARTVLGPEKAAEAFEGLRMQPSGLGLVQEADKIAAERIDYRPPRLTLPSLDEAGDAMEAADDDLGAAPRARHLRGVLALRTGQVEEALAHFRQAVELDLELYAAYYGWAACDRLLRLEPFPEVADEFDKPAALHAVFPDLANMAPIERHRVHAAARPVMAFLPTLAELGHTCTVHPMDVRLTDLYPQRVPMRFEAGDRPLPAVGTFASKGKAHTRLDEFLVAQPEQFAFARNLGYLVADALEAKGGAPLEKARALLKAVQGRYTPGQAHPSSAFDEFLASALENLVCLQTFGDAARSEFTEAWEQEGVFNFLQHLGR
jgi:tetratricopeptide (TPR) repeat protein